MASVDPDSSSSGETEPDVVGQPPLIDVTWEGDVSEVERLLQHGGDVNGNTTNAFGPRRCKRNLKGMDLCSQRERQVSFGGRGTPHIIATSYRCPVFLREHPIPEHLVLKTLLKNKTSLSRFAFQ